MAGVTSVVIDGVTYPVDDVNAVDFSEDQGLSAQQQQQGRSNIGAAAEAALASKADKADLNALAGTVGELSDDVDALTDALADKASAIVDTASGAIASFPDGAAVAAKDITIGIEPVQSGSGDPSPDNVRPISGWTGANVTRTGKNLFDKTAVSSNTWIIVNSTETQPQDGYWTSDYIPVKANAKVYMPRKDSARCAYYDKAKNGIAYFAYNGGSALSPLYDGYIRVTADSNEINLDSFYICYGESEIDYEPFGTTYPISWQSEAGTVYGGTLDVTTGLLTVTMAEVDLGTLTWVKGNRNIDDTGYVFSSSSITGTAKANENIICSSLIPLIPRVGTWEKVPANHIEIDGYKSVIVSAEYPDAASFKTAMSGVQLVYELATPQTYQLTPTEVEMLLGDNNVWADTGDSTVTYRADTKRYIQKINAPTDDDMIADAQIASGKYFIVGGNLYKSTTTIPAGDTINPGSNCILTNLADALNALNT